MERGTGSTSTPWVLLCVTLVALVWTMQQVHAGDDPPPTTPQPKQPQCQQDNKAREIGARFLFSGDEDHYAQVLAERTDGRYDRVLSDGVFVREWFDAGSVGPVVFHPDGDRFALIAAHYGQKYILEYMTGGETPLVAERIEDAWKNWVCFGATGKYLFTIAKHNKQWNLDVLEEQSNAKFVRFPLNGDPSRLELLAVRADGSEGFQYQVASGPMQMEIKSWLK